jgi:hypothetical protein
MASLENVHLAKSDLFWADLRVANLEGADLTEADLRWANLQRAHLAGAALEGARLNNAIGNGREIKSVQLGAHYLVWSTHSVAIGCRQFRLPDLEVEIEEYLTESDKVLWEANKDFILTLLEKYPAEG